MLIARKIFLSGLMVIAFFSHAEEKPADRAPVWREDFSQMKAQNDLSAQGWELKTKFGTPAAQFKLVNNPDGQVLKVTASKASGTLINRKRPVNLQVSPVIKWQWLALELPKNADGRDVKKDDQAIAVYVGTGNYLNQKSIAYRWETVTPKNTEGTAFYGGGMVQVRWFCLRNEQDKTGQWFVEERNVAADFQKAYGFVPEKAAVSIVANSQYTGSNSGAEIIWIEFPAPSPPIAQREK